MEPIRKKAIIWKWSPFNEFRNHARSELKNKHIITGNEVLKTVLYEGHDFHEGPNFREGHDFRETKRESINQGSREIMGNITKNPFMNNNYLEDIINQETFLTPKNSNFEFGK